MSQLTYANLSTQVLDWAPGWQAGPILRASNLALRDVYALVGPTVRFTLTTTAIYNTGTVAVTQGDTAVTLTTGTFAAGTDKQIIQMSGENTWYEFTRSSGSAGVIGSGFAGTTLTAGTFTVAYAYYDLPTTVSSVFSLWRGPRKRLARMNDEERDRFMDTSQVPGTPLSYLIAKGTTAGSSAVRIMLVPYPDTVYTFLGSGRARPTVFTGSGTEYTGLPEDYDQALIAGTLYYILNQKDKADSSAWWKREWEDFIGNAKAQQNEGFDTQYNEAQQGGEPGSVWQTGPTA
jgi:hypothetical protein